MILSIEFILLNSSKVALTLSLTLKDLETNYFTLSFHLDFLYKSLTAMQLKMAMMTVCYLFVGVLLYLSV